VSAVSAVGAVSAGVVFLDGEVVELAHARVPITDRGLRYGDGVFEVLRTANGRPFLLERHLARLATGAAAIALSPPPAVALADAVLRATAALLATYPVAAEARLRILLSRGDAELSRRLADAGPPRLVVIAEPLALPSDDAYARGIALATVARRMIAADALDPRVKSLAYLDRVLALEEARAAGAHEALRLAADGRVAECATANVFYVRGGTVTTPPADRALAGVTRGLVLELCAEAGLPTREHAPAPAELAAADEVFVTSAVKGVMPVSRLDEQPRAIGPTTRQLMQRYRDRLASTSS
jgi:branched-chain amino acid aminotransferase